MMKFMSRLRREDGDVRGAAGAVAKGGALQYESVVSIDSKSTMGVRFAIHRISFGRRLDLSRRVRELSRRAEFLAAGTELNEKIEAGILAQEIDAMYLQWGLASIEGFIIDDEPATAVRLLEKGPVDLVREIVSAIKEQCGLSEAETKN
jgi:hypothetical protein